MSAVLECETLSALTAHIPYIDFLGVTFEPREDALIGRLRFQDHLVGNPLLPAIHGGATGAFLEITAIITLAWTRLNDGREAAEIAALRAEDGALPPYPKPIDISFDYLRSGKPQDTLAKATIMRLGRRVANVRVEAWQADRGKPIATAHGNFLIPRTEG